MNELVTPNKKFQATLSLGLYLMFFLSGATSLVYETLWVRILSLGVGSTSSSLSMVLSIFFFGLGLGSYLSGKWAHKVKNPIFMYGLMEGLSGIFALLIIYPLLNFHSLLTYFSVAGSFSFWGIFFKFILVFIFLILPSVCMGATLPLLVKIYARKEELRLGRTISFLYALNTFGAVFGAFMTSFFLIPKLGVLKANYWTVGVSLFVLVACYLIAKKWALQSKDYLEEKIDKNAKHLLKPRNLVIIISCFICGYSSITSQVVWNKYLGIFFGTNIFGLGVILSLFLVGIALGSLILSKFIQNITKRHLLFFVLFFLSAFSVYLTSLLLGSAPLLTNILGFYLGGMLDLIIIKSIISGLFLLPSTLLFGALLPLAISILSTNSKEAPYITGISYSLNTMGSILAAYLTGIIIIPKIGSAFSITLAMSLLIIISVIISWTFFKRVTGKILITIAGAVALLLFIQTTPLHFKNIIKSAYFQNSLQAATLKDALKYFSQEHEEFKFIYEGKTALISLSHDQHDGEYYSDYLRLKTNGLNESIYDTKSLNLLPKYEGLLAFLPYFFVRDPGNAFVVGYGGGYSVDFLTQTDLKLVHAVELEEGIIKAAQMVYDGNNPILKRNNLKLEIEDARYVLMSSPKESYDIIISQPSHSWLSGVANLFTQDFFQIVNTKLTDKGVFSQWLNLYNMDVTVLKSILKTFYSVFPHGMVFTNFSDDELIMLGSKTPLNINMQKLSSIVANKKFKTILSDLSFESPLQFLSNFSMSREKVWELTKSSPINTDINAFAEVRQSSLFYSSLTQEQLPQNFLSKNVSTDLFSFIKGDKATQELYGRKFLNELLFLGKFDKFFTFFDSYMSSFDVPAKHIASFCLNSELYGCALKNYEHVPTKEFDTKVLNEFLSLLIDLREYGKAQKIYTQFLNLSDTRSKCYALEINLKSNSNYLPSKRELNECLDYSPLAIANYLFKNGKEQESLDLALNYYEYYGANLEVLSLIVPIYLSFKDYESYNYYSSLLTDFLTNEQIRLEDLVMFFEQKGWDQDIKVLRKKYDQFLPPLEEGGTCQEC